MMCANTDRITQVEGNDAKKETVELSWHQPLHRQREAASGYNCYCN